MSKSKNLESANPEARDLAPEELSDDAMHKVVGGKRSKGDHPLMEFTSAKPTTLSAPIGGGLAPAKTRSTGTI